MAQHLLFGEHMTANDVHRPIAETYLGQAHIAGTGPEGRTCRECKFWHGWKWQKLVGGKERIATDPGYFGKKHKLHPLGLKKAKCNRLIPHCAKACRLFEPAEHPLPERRPDN